MKRKIYSRLLDWKRNEASRCALLIEGARRVGKSYIVEEFAKSEYKHHLIIDFANTTKAIKELFEEKLGNLDEFFMMLEVRTGVELIRGETLIVFDEVQRFPRAREAIKYLVADGRFHYIETGSLISIKRNVEGIVIPSEELKIQMFPLDFEEFLWAVGKAASYKLVENCYFGEKPLDAVDHRMMMEYFRQYLVVGGMPQAVEAFVRERRLEEVEFAKKLILDLYYEDVGKYAGRLKNKVRAIWRAIPGELSLQDKRFSPGAVERGVRMRELDAPFDWLASSMTVNLAYNVTDPNVGFALAADHEGMKCYLADTGLLVSMAFGDSPETRKGVLWKILTGKLEINKGMLMENVVAQMLRAAGRDLFFHKVCDRVDGRNRIEIEFLLSKTPTTARHNVIPIEVKSNNDYTTVSLERFKEKFPGYCAERYVLHPGNADFTGDIKYLPLYMTPLLVNRRGRI